MRKRFIIITLFLLVTYSYGMQKNLTTNEKVDLTTCPFCQKKYAKNSPSYGCSNHGEHALCLYENLIIGGTTGGLVDLISCTPSTKISYLCETCNSNVSLNPLERHNLYQDCLGMLIKSDKILLHAYLFELPCYLARSIINNMSSEEQINIFKKAIAENRGWVFLSRLPLQEWNTWQKTLSDEEKTFLEKHVPREIKFMQMDLEQRLIAFGKEPFALQHLILTIFWQQLSQSERDQYLDILVTMIAANKKDPIGERAGLFAALVENHALSPHESALLLEELIKEIDRQLSILEIAGFFIPQLNATAVYKCIKKVLNYTSCSKAIILLANLRHRLDEENEKKLLNIILDTIATKKSFETLTRVINELPPEQAFTWAKMTMDRICPSVETGASLLINIWYALDEKKRALFIHQTFQKTLSSPAHFKNTLLLLKKIPCDLAYFYTRKFCSLLQSKRDVVKLLFATYPRFDQKKRKEIYKTICENASLKPTQEELTQLLIAFPTDVVDDLLPIGLERLPRAEEKAQLLMRFRNVISPKQRILIAKDFAQKQPLAKIAICSIINAFGRAHMATYSKKQPAFYDFFTNLKPELDKLFDFCTCQLSAPFFEVIWPLIPEQEQQIYFAHMPPEKRTSLLQYFLTKPEYIKTLITYQKNLTSWWLNRPESERLSYVAAVPLEAKPKPTKK